MKQIIFVLVIMIPVILAGQDTPLMKWDFEKISGRNLMDKSGELRDTIEGNFEPAPGISGKGIRLDGFTTCVRRNSGDKMNPGNEFSVEAWVALGNYPWNWCPVITTESIETKGYRLMIGPLGQASFECAIGEQWIACTSPSEVLPLRKWVHIVGIYRENENIELYLNGELMGGSQINGRITHPRSDVIIGMTAEPGKPSDIHRTWGTLPAYYGIDGIVDEVAVHNRVMNVTEIEKSFQAGASVKADIAPRKLPSIDNHPRRFGAFYTKLKYYPGWDNLWPVEQDPDVVVCFEKSPVKLIFWRGIRYGASWVSENENWMTDQSVEAWEHGEKDREGCFEHMQDRHCRFSHVRIIENTPARVVVHWRYAPVSAYNNTWHPDQKTGWECWIDEYYYIYPDATAIRNPSWKKGSLGYPRQFQESLSLIHPDQMVSDLLEKDYALVADYDGNTSKQSFVENPNEPPYGPFTWDKTHDFTIQQYQFKSENKPFICFDPGNIMWMRNSGLRSYNGVQGCNHFPVGQARCDGRTTRMADRPSHATGFPISDPVIHETEDRYYWNGLYGMNEMSLDELIEFGRSWAFAPELVVQKSSVESLGYSTRERCYQLTNPSGQPETIEFSLKGDQSSPVINPVFYIKNWNGDDARILINGKETEDTRTGIKYELDGTDLIVFLFLDEKDEITVTIIPE